MSVSRALDLPGTFDTVIFTPGPMFRFFRVRTSRFNSSAFFAPFLFAGLVGVSLATGFGQVAGRPPGQLLLPESELPVYERELDHAALIRGWDKAALQRGEKIYQQVCHSCHGDLNLPGSMPDALRFSQGTFQHGSDPLAMYQTITRGWRLMAPQVQLVPQEKYDVIHYIREAFIAGNNPAAYVQISDTYLAGLPRGAAKGPAPVKREPWREMDYGRSLIGTFEVADAEDRALAAKVPAGKADQVAADANIAYKGIAVRLDPGAGGIAAGRAWVVFEHDTLRLAGAWTGDGFIDWEGINFNTRHVVRPRTIGEVQMELADGPGWANPTTGTFDDLRTVGVDGRRFGPLPRSWMRYRGLYQAGERVVISYDVGTTAVLESFDLEREANEPVVVRTLNVGASAHDLVLRVANAGTAIAVTGLTALTLETDSRFARLRIPAASTPLKVALRLGRPGARGPAVAAARATSPLDLSAFTRGGPARWTERIETPVVSSDDRGPFAWDRFTLPLVNPWRSRVRPSGVDFLPGGEAAVVCTWDGDVWRVDGIDGGAKTITWRRIASGLFQPLGIKMRGREVVVTCRDQLVVLRDLNGDGETDYYESLNSDHQVTEHFHEFAMGLQTDAAGNFYYAKSARHARTAMVPQHGTLLKVTADGSRTEILANGFRAANGVCLNPDGSFFVTDQEGHWIPMNRINRVVPGSFYGNMWSYGAPSDASDAAMAPPLCWIDKAFDRSPAELVRVEGAPWRTFAGTLLNLSYGRGRIEVVVADTVEGVQQGAVCALPLPDFPTGIMRARFHPTNGQLYACGLSAWATSQTLQEGGFYRLRPTGKPALLPVGWHIGRGAIELTFSEPLARAALVDTARFAVKVWSLKRSAAYGSARLQETQLEVAGTEAMPDSRRVRLLLPALAPTDMIEITCRLPDGSGAEVERVIQGTVHRIPRGTL